MERREIRQNVNLFGFRWVGLVGKNYEIECAIAELEKEVQHLRQQPKSNGTTTTIPAEQ